MENTKIQWADHTFNPWRGCTKIAPGCANCYADAQSKRNPTTLGVWGPSGTRVVASEAMWRQPLRWERAAETTAEVWPEDRPRVFCGSMCDVFEYWPLVVSDSNGSVVNHYNWKPITSEGPKPATLDDVRARLFQLIDSTPNLDWLLLTKRPENVRRMVPVAANGRDPSDPQYMRRDNVWIGTSIACQDDADRLIPELLKCRDLCAKLFLSVEPLLGPVDLETKHYIHDLIGVDCHDERPISHRYGIDWVIVGGESGPHARPCNVAWIRSIVEQCHAAGVPCFVKQFGSRPIRYVVTAVGQDAYGNVDDNGKWEAWELSDKKGGDPAEWPEDIRVREVPT